MSIIALDIHPQCKFSCFAANDKQCVHHPHEIVPELNHQSTFADKRVLVESQPDNHLHDFCSSFFQRHDTPRFLQESDSHFGQYVQHCQSNGLLSGLPASTPVAIVQNTSLPHQRHAVTTLGNLQHTIHQEQLGSPAVMVVGDVVRGVAAVQSTTTHVRAA